MSHGRASVMTPADRLELSAMPNVMIRRNSEGDLLFYVAKKDLEAGVVAVERDSATEWGGEVELDDGSKFYIDPISPPPSFPTTLRFRKARVA